MDTADLRVFEAVARLGGMSSAARELNTVQSNVTARIRQLEARLGVVLFDRSSRGVTLTAAGRRLLPYASRVQALVLEAARAAADDGSPAGPLQVGSLETTAAIRLSPILADYVAAWPEVDLSLVTGTTAELIERVLGREIEGAFVCGPVRHPQLVETTIFREELAAITAPSVRSFEQLLAAPGLRVVVLRTGCSYRQRLESILANRGTVGLRTLELGTIEGILGCVAAGLGVSLLPKALAAPAESSGRVAVHALPPAEALVDTVFIRRRDGHVSSALAALLDHAAASVREEAHAAE